MIEVGSLNRAILLVVSQIAVVFIAIMVGYACTWTQTSRLEHSRGHLLLSGSVLGFLHMQQKDHWVLDRASCAMCGLITLHQSLFDVKLWLLVTDKAKSHTKWGMKRFDHAWLNVHDDLRKVHSKGPPVVLVNRAIKLKNRLVALAGLVYVIATLFGSVTFLTLTSTNMANDFWWANYSAMREHIYVSRLLNSQITLRPHAGSISLSDHKFLDDANYSIGSSGQIGTIVKQLYSSLVLSTDGTDLATVIHGLRSMDGCLAPWISSQYCWLDFDKRWEMANSAARQIRCANNYSTNAAVYLESVLRNVQLPQLRSCWGTSLDIALGAPLKNLPNGTTWWMSVQSAKIPEDDELKYWHSFGMTTYATDWQNYKSIGIIESFNIRNAFGLSYRMALKHTNGSFNLVAQTSMKMYWSFASDLWAVTDPSTSVYGASLIRQDGSFAFINRSMESLLIENGTLRNSELTSGGALSAFRETIGPFGFVDLKRVPVPPSMLAFSVYFMDIAAQLRIESTDFATFWIGRPQLLETWYMPPPWLETNAPKVIGGNLLCREVPRADESSGLYLLTGASSACGTSVGEQIRIPRLSNLFALVGANLVRPNLTTDFIDDVCATMQTVDDFSCTDNYILPSLRFLLNDSMVDPSLLANLRSMAEVAQKDMHTLAVEINQYGRTVNGIAVLMRHEIFDPAYPSFHYIAWVLAMEWATNNREVISFQGNLHTANVITARSFDVASLVNPLEIPVNVAYYIRYVCLYVTIFVISVATLATLYILRNKGNVEGLNLFAINRVVGIVWIGRTFLFIRSMAAICLLSTQVLSLENVNDLWRLVDATHLANESSIDRGLRIFKTILAAGEVSWLCYVLSDILTLFTAQYTTGYTIKCTTLVWIVSAIISLAAPATHVATLQRECQYAQVDFQLICTSGTIAIGSFGRFLLLVGICIGSVALCYLYERLRHPSLPPSHQTSLFLSASAKYIFRRDKWTLDDEYYIDPASAAINGILSVRVGSTFFLFDLKTWRLFVINVSKENRERIKHEGKLHLLSSIPLPS
ncbi:hypothetical protein AC1031_014161 [Aphanomyces cochlioides]|nr:hypothetical protein AC1031_014161 [Aphanomyces cochlioides]